MSCHDVRKLKTCFYCDALAFDPPRFWTGVGKGSGKLYAHAACLLKNLGGYKALLDLPPDQLDKVRLGDLKPAQMKKLLRLLDERKASAKRTKKAQPGREARP